MTLPAALMANPALPSHQTLTATASRSVSSLGSMTAKVASSLALSVNFGKAATQSFRGAESQGIAGRKRHSHALGEMLAIASAAWIARMKPVRITETCRFRSDKFLPELLCGSSVARVFALCLEPGQNLPPRPDSEEALCFLAEGSGTIQLDDASFPMAAGDFAVASAGTVRGFTADTRCVALWIQVSPKDGADG